MSPWPSEFEAILREFLPGLAEQEDIIPDTVLGLYGFDSLALVTLIVELETEFDCPFPEEAMTIETFYTAGTLWEAFSPVIQAR